MPKKPLSINNMAFRRPQDERGIKAHLKYLQFRETRTRRAMGSGAGWIGAWERIISRFTRTC